MTDEHHMKTDATTLSLPFVSVILILFIGFWSTLYLDSIVNMDVGWLLQCLDRFFAGGTYSQDFYETNPPLSFLIYTPIHPLYNQLGWNAQDAVTLLFYGYIALALTSFGVLLKKLGCTRETIILIMSACLFSSTWAAGLSFGQRDQLVFLFMLPLLTYQYALTINLKPPAIIAALSVIMGGIAIALKPHYGIISALFFAHRLYQTRSLKRCIITPDFLGMGAIGASYIAFIFLFTPDFISIVLPEVVSLYTIDKPFELTERWFYALYGLTALGFIFMVSTDNKTDSQVKKAVIIFSVLSMLYFIPYILQNKGFHYHAYPALAMGMCALFLCTRSVVLEIFKKKNLSFLVACCLICTLTYSTILGRSNDPFMSAEEYLETDFVKSITDNAWNGKFAVYDLKNPVTSLPFLAPVESVSRFGQYWTLYNLFLLHAEQQTEEDKERVRERMIQSVEPVAEDIKRHQPSVLVFPQYGDLETGENMDHFYNFLNNNSNFAQQMDQYELLGTKMNNTCFTTSTDDPECLLAYKIFVRKRDQKEDIAP